MVKRVTFRKNALFCVQSEPSRKYSNQKTGHRILDKSLFTSLTYCNSLTTLRGQKDAEHDNHELEEGLGDEDEPPEIGEDCDQDPFFDEMGLDEIGPDGWVGGTDAAGLDGIGGGGEIERRSLSRTLASAVLT